MLSSVIILRWKGWKYWWDKMLKGTQEEEGKIVHRELWEIGLKCLIRMKESIERY